MADYKKTIFVLARPAYIQRQINKIGGVIISSRILVKQFDSLSIPYVLVDTYRVRLKYLSLFSILLTSIKKIQNNDITFLNINEREIIFLGVPLVFISKILKKRILVRFFGGNLDILYSNSWLFKISINYIFSKADHVLLQTKYLCDYFKRSNCYWFPTSRPKKLVKKRSSKSLKYKKLKLIFVGNVSKNKGINLLIDVAMRLNDFSINISVYGPLIDISENDMHKAGIFYGGILSHDQVHRELSKHHYFCLPTMHNGEGYPGSVIEAFNAGLPVISSNWRSIPEIVKEDETGLLFEPGDANSLAKAILKARKYHFEGFKFNLSKTASKFDAKKIYTLLVKDLMR